MSSLSLALDLYVRIDTEEVGNEAFDIAGIDIEIVEFVVHNSHTSLFRTSREEFYIAYASDRDYHTVAEEFAKQIAEV